MYQPFGFDQSYEVRIIITSFIKNTCPRSHHQQVAEWDANTGWSVLAFPHHLWWPCVLPSPKGAPLALGHHLGRTRPCPHASVISKQAARSPPTHPPLLPCTHPPRKPVCCAGLGPTPEAGSTAHPETLPCASLLPGQPMRQTCAMPAVTAAAPSRGTGTQQVLKRACGRHWGEGARTR